MVEWGELSFKVVRLEAAGQEVLARAGNFLVAQAAFDTSVYLWASGRNRITAKHHAHGASEAETVPQQLTVILFEMLERLETVPEELC